MDSIIQANRAVLSKLSQALGALGAADLEKLTKPEYRLELVVKRVRAPRSDVDSTLSLEALADLNKNLEEAESREQAHKLLESLTRDSLQSLLKSLDVPFQRRDSKEELLEKAVENTVGFKLRSAAISKPG